MHPKNHVFDGDPDPQRRRDNVWVLSVPLKSTGSLAAMHAKMAEMTEMPFGKLTRVGPRNHVLDGDQDPPREEADDRTPQQRS